MRRTSYLAGVIAVTLTLGCNDHLPSDNPSAPAGLGRGQAAIIDGNSGGNGYFRFLPPVVANAGTLPAPNDKKLYPEMDVCLLANGECASVVWAFSRANKQPQNRTLKVGNSYGAEWDTRPANLDPGSTYRVRVMLDKRVIGYADVDVVETSAELGGVDKNNFLGVVKGSKVDLNFWISTGYYTYIVGRTGGQAGASDGMVRLDIPKGAVEDMHIGIRAAQIPNVPGAIVVPNTYFEFTPDGLTFQKPAQLTIKLNPKWVPPSVRPQDVKLLHFKNGAWSEVPGSINEVHKFQVRGEINGFSGYAIGVLTGGGGPAVVDVAVNTQPVILGAPLNAVQRIRGAAAQTSCSNNLRQVGLLANNMWTRSASIPIVNGECPFSAHIARAGAGYQIEGTVDGITGTSSVFDVTLPSGAQLRFQNLPAGPFFADGNVPTNGITILAQDGQGNPMRFVDVDITVSGGGSLNFGGAPQTLYPARTDASGVIALPAGNWRLAPTPQTNTLAAVLPGTSVAAAHDIVTTSGAPQALIAVPMPASIQVNTQTSIEVTARDAQGNLVSINQPFSAVANGPNGESQLGSVDAVNGRATFNVSFAQPGYNNTITFSAAGLTSHTTNAFTIWQLPAPPTALQVSSPTQTGFDLGYQVAAVFGSNPRRIVSWQSVNQPNGSVETALAPMFGGGQVVDPLRGLLANTRYSVRSRVCIDEGCSADSQPAEAFTLPGAMVNLRARTIEQNRIVMESDAAAGGPDVTNTYRFYVSSNGGAAQQACNAASPVCDLTGLAAATTYSISGEVCNPGGCGPRSAPVQVTTLAPPPPPGAPNRLQINSQAFNSIVLAWSDNSSNEDGFRVMRRVLPSTTFVQIGATAPNVATFNDTDLIQGLTVVYRVDAFNTGGSSSSNETSTIVPTGQTQPMATYGTLLTQTGTAGVAAPSPARVRLITSPTSSFVTLVPRTTVVVVNTTSTGIATAPAWILESGTSTVVASAPGYNQVTFTAIAN